jgi:hypothetical protein
VLRSASLWMTLLAVGLLNWVVTAKMFAGS